MSNTENDEALARLRRIETKVFLIGEKLDIAAKGNEPFKVTRDVDGPTMDIPGVDVTLARIKRDMTLQGIDPYAVGLYLVYDGETVAYVEFMK